MTRTLSAEALTEVTRGSGARIDLVATWQYDTCDPAAIRTITSSGADISGDFSRNSFRIVDAQTDWVLPFYGEGFSLPTASVMASSAPRGELDSANWSWFNALINKTFVTRKNALILKARIWLPTSGIWEDITLFTGGTTVPQLRDDPPDILLTGTHRLESIFDYKMPSYHTSATSPVPLHDPIFDLLPALDPSYDSTAWDAFAADTTAWALETPSPFRRGVYVQFYVHRRDQIKQADFAFDLVRYGIATPYVNKDGNLSVFRWRDDRTDVADLVWTDSSFVWGSGTLRHRMDRVFNYMVHDVCIERTFDDNGALLTGDVTQGPWIPNPLTVYFENGSIDNYGLRRKDWQFSRQWAYGEIKEQWSHLFGVFGIGDVTQGWFIPSELEIEVPFKVGLRATVGDRVRITHTRLQIPGFIFRIERMRLSWARKSWLVTMHDRVYFPDIT